MRTRHALLIGFVAALLLAAPAGAAPTLTRISSGITGGPGNGLSEMPGVSDDCRFVTFTSAATNIVPQDGFTSDVFIRDRSTGAVDILSVNTAGELGFPSSGGFLSPAPMSADGRYVAFDSFARNLVPGDTNESVDVFLRDRVARTTTRISVDSTGGQAESSSSVKAMSADGRFVLFTSRATNLVPGETNGTVLDAYIHDNVTGKTTLVSLKRDGTQVTEDTLAYDMSNDGRFVAFESFGVYTSGDRNNARDGFVKDLATGAVERVTVTNAGKEFRASSSGLSMSADGRVVAFSGGPPTIVPQVYVRDRAARTTRLVSVNRQGEPGNRSSMAASVSANGRYVAFSTGADDIAGPPTNFLDLYVRDLQTKTTVLASVTSTGAPIQQSSGFGAMCNAGVAFTSFYPAVMPDSDTVQQLYFRTN